MSMIQEKTTSTNVLQQPSIHARKGEKGDNVPSKQQIAKSGIQNLQNLLLQIQDKQSDVEKQSNALEEMLDSDLSDLSNRKKAAALSLLTKSLSQTALELAGQLNEAQEQLKSAGLLPQSTEDSSGNGSDDSSQGAGGGSEGGLGPMFCGSYQAEATAALNELASNLVILQALQRKLQQAVLQQERGNPSQNQVGTIQAQAKAAMGSADSTADGLIAQGAQSVAQGVLSGINAGVDHVKQTKADAELTGQDGASTKLNEVQAFRTQFNETKPASVTFGNGATTGPTPLTDPEQARYEEIVEGSGNYKIDRTMDDNVIAHIKANDADRRDTLKALNQREDGLQQEISAAQSRTAGTRQRDGNIFNMATQATQATSQAIQSQYTGKGGEYTAMQTTAKYSADQLSGAATALGQASQASDAQIEALAKARTAVNSQQPTG